MKSQKLKLSLVVGVAALLVCLPLVNPAVEASSSGGEREVTVNCSVVNDNTKAASAKKTISLSEAQKLSSEWERAADAFETLYNADDETDAADKEEAQRIIENVVNMMQRLDILPGTTLTKKLLRKLLMPSHTMDFLGPVVSVGKGRTWIPMYPGEAFIGMMLRPIFVLYPMMGYTASLNAGALASLGHDLAIRVGVGRCVQKRVRTAHHPKDPENHGDRRGNRRPDPNGGTGRVGSVGSVGRSRSTGTVNTVNSPT